MTKPLTVGAVALVIVVGLGFTFYILTAPGAPVGTLASVSSTKTVSQSGQAAPAAGGYSCGTPAINSQNFCDKLPVGYQIAPHLPNGPPPYCAAGMTASACQLLKQTWSNGVCDPNETVWTDPLDCGCTGAVTGDPFTGRCGAPATLCQVQAQAQQKQLQG